MKRNLYGALSLLLVTGIAMVMLVGFGFRATSAASHSQVSGTHRSYMQVLMRAKGPSMP